MNYKKCIKAVLMRFPLVGIVGISVLRVFRFWPERRAYSGKDLGEGNGRPSLVFFTHYRCASMMLMKRLGDLVEGAGYEKRDYQGLVHPWPIEQREEFQRNRQEHEEVGRFNSKGRFYGPLRYFVDIPDLRSFKTVVVLRDPRDVLVSRYYSEKYAHVRLDKRFLSHCRQVETMEIDEFAVHFTEDVGSHYRLFMEHWEDLEEALVIPYERVIEDFPGFLSAVNDYVGLGKSEEAIKEIAAKETFAVQSEDRYSHKRSVTSRNFEKKLKPETIQQLNASLGDILTHFGWEI